MNKVFVYGTLKRGEYNNILLSNIPENTCLGEETLSGFCMYSLGAFPAVLHSEENTDIIHGEVWEVTEFSMKSLDILEGHPTFYKRELVTTSFGEAWMYIFQDPTVAEDRTKITSW